MDSSSIVSFNNDSTFQTTLKGDISVHELALHAMRDRCLLLQKRINALETDNMRLKLDVVKATECSPSYSPVREDDKLLLHQKIAELKKQKSKLMHHVIMVQCENKNLWNKIATLNAPDKSASKEHVKQPLIRTNTYIHSTPKASTNYEENYLESSLEEISLKLIDSYIQGKSQLVEQYEQMAQLQDIDDDLLNVDSIGFTYMEDPATDSLKEIQTQTEKLNNLKNELKQQETDLKLIITRVETVLRDGYKCPSCMTSNPKIVSSEHKEIETSDSLANWATPTDSSNYNNNFSELNTSGYKQNMLENEKEIMQDPCDKICPMCGQTFQKEIPFSEFQAHVENHFLGDNEPESMTDFENVPNSFANII